jgi:predicted transcriptional regulator
MNESKPTPTSLRLPDGLLRQLTKAAHKLEMSRTAYITSALQAAVRHDLPSTEYQQAWDELQDIYDNLSPDIDENGLPDADMRLAAALETVLPRLRGAE